MIVPMKKIFLVVQDKDVLSALEALRQEGTVHVEPQQKPQGASIDKLKEKVDLLERVVSVLSQKPRVVEQKKADSWNEKTEEVLGFVMFIEQLQENLVKRQEKISQWEPWGDYNPEDVELLRNKGINLQFVEIPKKEISNVPDGVILEPVSEKNGVWRCVAIGAPEVKIPFHALPLPPVSWKELKSAQEKDLQRIQDAGTKISEMACYLDGFQKALAAVNEELTFQEVYEGRGEEEVLAVLKGFCPNDRCGRLKEIAKNKQWGLLIEEPTDEDIVPTLLRNPKWIEVIKPAFGLIKILPGYKEVDISAFFLLFFSMFFGMLIGDAGYGGVFFLATLFAHIKMGKKISDQKIFSLMYVLSGATIMWGILTGVFFGQKWISSAIFSPAVPWLTDNTNIQMFCFLVGAIHLSIAHIWRAVMKAPALTFLGEIGWLAIVWGMFFAAKMLVLGSDLPAYAMAIFGSGTFLIIFFTKPNKNPLKAMGPGLGDFFLNVINTFTDVVSYIRLFAVGLATVAIADAFNEMAMGIGFNNVLAGGLSAFILVVGHMFNIILGGMSILVHGLRLNVLEFSRHLNMEWTGFEYNPFKKTKEV